MEKLMEQSRLAQRTKRFLEKYGMKAAWLAEKINVQKSYFSTFLTGHAALYDPQVERLTEFLNEWEKRMVGFDAVEN